MTERGRGGQRRKASPGRRRAPASGRSGDRDRATAGERAAEAEGEGGGASSPPSAERGVEGSSEGVGRKAAMVDEPPAAAGPEAAETPPERQPEEEAAEVAADEQPPETAAEDPLARAEAERDEYLGLAQRAQADFENYRKRAAKEITAAGARGKADLVRELLPVVDNLERALASAGGGEKHLAQGVRLVLAELVAALERNGVRSIEPAGERFDPNLHEALSTRAENGAEPGVVLDVVQKGYRLEHNVLRPARVVVAA